MHLISDALFRVDGCLDDVEEGSDTTVHFTEQAVCVFHVNVREDALEFLDVPWVNPLCMSIDAGRFHCICIGNNEDRYHINKGASHVNSTLRS